MASPGARRRNLAHECWSTESVSSQECGILQARSAAQCSAVATHGIKQCIRAGLTQQFNRQGLQLDRASEAHRTHRTACETYLHNLLMLVRLAGIRFDDTERLRDCKIHGVLRSALSPRLWLSSRIHLHSNCCAVLRCCCPDLRVRSEGTNCQDTD